MSKLNKKSDLFKRTITGVVLTAIVLMGIFYLPLSYFIGIMTVLMLWAAWEWSGLCAVKSKTMRALYVTFVFALFCAVIHVPVIFVLWAALCFWLICACFVFLYPRATFLWVPFEVVKLTVGIFALVPCWLAVNVIRGAQDGAFVLLFMLLIIWVCDTGAYFMGRSFGRHALMPHVSPKKTWEGLWGGLLFVLVVAILWSLFKGFSPWKWLLMIVFSFIVAIISVVGDLTESMLKRAAGVKDSGVILPGHGGILDRIDSLMAAAPIFLLGCLLLGMV